MKTNKYVTLDNMKEMEYEDAPSGYVTLYNYKEPFMPYQQGFGYLGVLLFDGETDKVQCHMCGEWFGSLSHHLVREHAMRATQYKDEVGLNQTTALIGEKMREKLIASGLDKRLQNLRAGGKMTNETKKKISETLKANSLENKNLRGTCPAQLIDRLRKKYDELGRTPKDSETPAKEALIMTYGSMQEACRIAGIPYRKPSQTINNPRTITKDQVIQFLATYAKEQKKFPRHKDIRNTEHERLWKAAVNKKWSFPQMKKEAIKINGEYVQGSNVPLGKEGLVFMLRKFYEVHGRQPSVSDAKRRLVPPPSSYYYHFKSWNEALQEAFPNN
jgi:Homing endonuclease associated repeat